jgi:long-chain fatty acid transport protein
MHGRQRILVLLLGLLLAASRVYAQVGPPVFQFSFSNPGARSLGLGGAFAALADDATAAFANPAGLVQLARPEVSIEGRQWSFSTPVAVGGRVTGQPTGIGLDDSPGIKTAESTEDTSGLSFLSFVYPRKDWSLAIYRHQLANFELTWETAGLFGDPSPGFPGPRLPDLRAFVDFELESHAVAVA